MHMKLAKWYVPGSIFQAHKSTNQTDMVTNLGVYFFLQFSTAIIMIIIMTA